MAGSIDQWPSNYFLNMSACDPLVGYCGKVTKIANWGSTQAGALQYDSKGTYEVSVLSKFYLLGTHTFLLLLVMHFISLTQRGAPDGVGHGR
jgi:hypothetical protein